MKITFCNEQNKVDFTKEIRDAITAAFNEAASEEGIDFCVDLLITDDENIRSLNCEFRGADKATDVLSFPAYDFVGLLKDNIGSMDLEIEDGLIFIGDIAVSLERAVKQASEYGHSLLRETVFLALHGLLHLHGYDHMEPSEEEIMTARQREILGAAGVARE